MLDTIGAVWRDYGSVIIAISAAVTLLGAVFNLMQNNSISEKAVKQTGQTLSAGQEALSADHKALSAEHSALRSDHSILLERSAGSQEVLQSLSSSLREIDRRMLQADAERKVQFLTLDAQRQQLVKSAGDMGRFAEEYIRLSAENQTLKQTVERLQRKLNTLQAEFPREPEEE